jgi:cytochrome c oxidase assembly protein subunit 15
MTTALPLERPVRQRDFSRIRPWIRAWLWLTATLLIGMIVLGGITRLTQSGLSITDWQLIHGVIPPLSDADWQQEFANYQQTPQFHELNASMSLDDFKGIFWWEWAHRLLGRIIGALVILPLIVLWATGRLERQLLPRLLTIAGLVVFQGIVGWWMVESGLDATDVNPLWLTFHLVLGCFTLAYTTYIAASLSNSTLPTAPLGVRRMAGLILIVSFLQVFLGGLMSGTNAGLTFNTWPLIDGQWIPVRLLFADFHIGNLISDAATIQFEHRTTAYLLLLLLFIHLVQTWRTEFSASVFGILWLVAAQALLGIVTLVLIVPVWIAVPHLLGAVLVLFTLVIYWRAMTPPLPLPLPAGA